MEILVLLVPLSMLLIGVALVAFTRAVDGGQFDDLDRHGLDIFDEQDSADPARSRSKH